MRELVQDIIEASKGGPLFIGGRAQRWAGCAYDDGQGGVVWVELGLWLQDQVSHHPMHSMGVPIMGWGDHWMCEDPSEYESVFLAPPWHPEVEWAWQEFRTLPPGWREGRGLDICRSIAPRARA